MVKKLMVIMIFCILLSGCSKNNETKIEDTAVPTVTEKPAEKNNWYTDIMTTTSDNAKLLPIPEGYNYCGMQLYVESVSEEQYESYIKKCIEKGFNIDAKKGTDYYNAFNKEGYQIALAYSEGWGTIYIQIEDPKDAENLDLVRPKVKKLMSDWEEAIDVLCKEYAEATDKELVIDTYEKKEDKILKRLNAITDASEEEMSYCKDITAKLEKRYNSVVNDDPSDSIGSKFKETMDGYEKFFDEYVDFMKKYKESKNSIKLLSKYTEFLTQYTDTMTKLNDIQNEDLSDEELKYYTKVSLRISQKLLEVEY